MLRLFSPALLVVLAGCPDPSNGASVPADGAVGAGGGAQTGTPDLNQQDPNQLDADRPAPVLGYEVVKRYPHDVAAYTQGLLIVDGVLYEGTGQKGASSLRIVDLETGRVKRKRDLPPQVFGEGIASVGGLLYQLTWKAGRAFIFQRDRLVPQSYGYSYPGEGWGLTTTEEGLVMSDGTPTIRILDPKGLKEIRRVVVRDGKRAIRNLNELEWIDGLLWANVWKSNRVARIDLETGKVHSWIDFSGLLGDYRVGAPLEDVLNGIAIDEATGKIYVTGKRWPTLFEIRVKE